MTRGIPHSIVGTTFCSITLSSCLLMQTFHAPVHDRMISRQPQSHVAHDAYMYFLYHISLHSLVLLLSKTLCITLLEATSKASDCYHGMNFDEKWPPRLWDPHSCMLPCFLWWVIHAGMLHVGAWRLPMQEGVRWEVTTWAWWDVASHRFFISAWSRAYRDIASWSILYIAGILHEHSWVSTLRKTDKDSLDTQSHCNTLLAKEHCTAQSRR